MDLKSLILKNRLHHIEIARVTFMWLFFYVVKQVKVVKDCDLYSFAVLFFSILLALILMKFNNGRRGEKGKEVICHDLSEQCGACG